MANNYEVNYDDKRFTQVETDKNAALKELENTYSGMIGESDKYYQAQIDASKQWADKQSQIQQDNTDFAIEQVEQQKDQAHKDYLKEQSGAYVDWRKQSNEYGAESEKMASSGLANTGYSESSQVSMYNTYQNRVATARDSYNRAVLNYDNAIKDARLQNNAALAEIAYTALQQQLELSLQGFQYKNNLILEQANKKLEVNQMYYNRYQDVLQQINTENAMAEQIRQFNAEYNEKVRQFNLEIERLKKKDAQEAQMQIEELELKKQQLAEEKRQFDATMAYQESKSSGGSGGSGYKVKSGNTSGTKQGGGSITSEQSIMALGRGPISSSELNRLVTSGQVSVGTIGNTPVAVNTGNTVPTFGSPLEEVPNSFYQAAQSVGSSKKKGQGSR